MNTMVNIDDHAAIRRANSLSEISESPLGDGCSCGEQVHDIHQQYISSTIHSQPHPY